ncbi:MAG: PrpF domain-containing protein [Pseudomonadota bacterium]
MEQTGIKCTFMRGGTSKGMFFRWEDLPSDPGERDGFLCAAIGSPDPYGRQLDGMGGGISSLSKGMMVRRSERAGVDVDYLFGQIDVASARVDYASNCGNLSAAVGAFAVDQGLVQVPDGPATVRMFNENTAKRIDCHLTVRDGRAAITGDQVIAGVAGQGSAIRLDFLDPGGARTTTILPTGEPAKSLDLERGPFRISFVDAANPCVFMDARELGCTAQELPSDLSENGPALGLLEEIRLWAGRDWDEWAYPHPVFRGAASAPKIAIVGPPADCAMLSGETLKAGDCDIQVRMISMGKPHLAIPLTGAMCTAVAARIPGTVVAEAARQVPDGQPLRIGTPSGVVPAMAEVDLSEKTPHAISASVYRTARTLMEGIVYATTR